MDVESTVSHDLTSGGTGEELSLTSYLINTSKAVKGHKLKTRDFVKIQLMKFRHCSPVKYETLVQPSLSPNTQFVKFKGFEVERDEDIHKIVTNQRQKMSRETKGRIKLFNNTKINSMFDDSVPTSQNMEASLRPKPATSHHSRIAHRNYSNFKTIGNDHNLTGTRQKTNKSLMFRSDNLDKKMNDCLNAYLTREKSQEEIHEAFPERISFGVLEERHSQTISVRKKPNITYLRRLKRLYRNRGEEGKSDLLSQFQSEQLVKPQTANPISRRQRVQLTQGKST